MGHSSKDTVKKSLNNVQKNELKTENRLSKLEKDCTIKDKRNLFRIKKKEPKKKDNIVKDVGNLFKLKKENNTIKQRIICDIRNFFELENYNPVRAGNSYSNNYSEYESNKDKNKTL